MRYALILLLCLGGCHKSEPGPRGSDADRAARSQTEGNDQTGDVRDPAPASGQAAGNGTGNVQTSPQGAAPAANSATMKSQDAAKKLAEKLAGASARVSVWNKAAVPGVHAFRVRPSARKPKTDTDDWFGVVIVEGKDRWLEGKDALRAVIERDSKNAEALARFALFLVERSNAEPIMDGQAPGAASVPAPAIRGRVLEYWSLQGAPGRVLYRSRVNLDSAEVARTSAGSLAAEQAGPLATARKNLAGTSRTKHRAAIRALADSCNKVPGAAALLVETMEHHASAYARAEAGKAVVTCHEPGAVTALVRILQGDKDEKVRMYAAEALGAIGDASARDALEAARDNDSSRKVTGAAKRALGKL